VIAECPQDRDDLIEHYGADPKRLNVIPCGYHPGELAPAPQDSRELRSKLGIRENEIVVLQLGRIVPRKGIDNVIRAVGVLERLHGLRVRLLVVGGNADEPDPAKTPEIGRLGTLAQQEGVADRVMFLGRRPRAALRALYSAADVFVTTPWYEPFGITPVEAMACGTAVIGADVGGIKFTVIDGVTGFLVPPKDPSALATQLAVLVRDSALRRSFGRAGARRARYMFTWTRIVRQISSLYGQIAANTSQESIANAY
jgi:D-inositol-3-phosphate glycosyltransferase